MCRPSSPGLSLGQTGFVPGTNPVKSGFHCVKYGENPGLSQVFTGFVPGTNPVKSPDKPGVVPRPTGQKNLCLCAFFLPEFRKGVLRASHSKPQKPRDEFLKPPPFTCHKFKHFFEEEPRKPRKPRDEIVENNP